MSDTPRTDLAIRNSGGQWSYVLKDRCEQLERELVDMTKQRDALADALEHTVNRIQDFEKCIAGRRRNPPSVSGALEFAAHALAAVKGGNNE
jgi:hypothetical protein